MARSDDQLDVLQQGITRLRRQVEDLGTKPPRGDKGGVGPRGPAGPKGLDGKPGTDGKPGPAGKDGKAGAIGSPGPQGPQGDRGAIGVAGPIGPGGPKGERGEQGPRGLQGPHGLAGPQGPRGVQGVPGRDGRDGADGGPGPPGKDGQDGRDGEPGKDGERGPRGLAGEKGDQGLTGTVSVEALDPLKKRIDLLEAETKKYVFGRPTWNPPVGGVGFPGPQGTSARVDVMALLVEDGPLISGAYREIVGNPWPTAISWYTDSSKAKLLASKSIVRNSANAPIEIKWRTYQDDGVTIKETVTDTIVNTGTPAVFEQSRTRTIS